MADFVCVEGVCGLKVGDELHRKWDEALVLLSWTIASTGAFTTLRTVAHVRYCADAFWYWTFVVLAGLSFGGLTVWDMHQVGMEALKLSATNSEGEELIVDIKYGLSFCVVSGVAAWIVGSIGIWIVTGRSLKQRNVRDLSLLFRLFASAVFVALGVCVMHYMGMLSMTGHFKMEWNAGIIVLSFAIAFTAAGAGLSILMTFPAKITMQLAAAAVIGFAVCGMHYTGMYGASYFIVADDQSFTGEEGMHVSGTKVTIFALLANIFLTIPLHHYSEEQRSKFETKLFKEREAEQKQIINLSSSVAQAMVNYNLLEAGELLLRCKGDDSLVPPLQSLLQNLTVYRAFLPHALFDTSKNLLNVPNDCLARALDGAEVFTKDVDVAVSRIRDPTYNLHDFQLHMERAYPELKLYTVGGGASTSGHDGLQEYQRTLSALFSVFAFLRLDIDGKEIVTFGVDESGNPRKAPAPSEGAEGEKKQRFYDAMDWDGLTSLMVRAGLQLPSTLELVHRRVVAMLALTAIHDIMKNKQLLPVVQKTHAPFNGFGAGEEVTDHDLALGYVLENYPSLLPSFCCLTPAQRAPVLFTQAKMNFNNGWLVQGEAPPGALFRSFRSAIRQGRASESDVSFYFVHWITDLAGAEPFGKRSWPGAEKLTTKLPPHVLKAFVASFQFVERLASASEVQVMDAYLRHRMDELKLIVPEALRSSQHQVGAMRLALMAQGFEERILYVLMTLPQVDQDVIGSEFARTGCKEHFIETPYAVRQRLDGPAFLVYYAPALIQKAGEAEARGALLVLANVLRVSRQMFPLTIHQCEETVTIRIDVLKVLKPHQIKEEKWALKQTGASSAEVVKAKEGLEAGSGSAVISLDLPSDITIASWAADSIPDFVDEI